MPSLTRLVLFDIDGTLLLTAGAGRRAISAALAVEVPNAAIFETIRFDGKTDPQIVAELLAAAGHDDPADPERIAAVCRRYVGELRDELARRGSETRVLPGILPLLDRLEQHGSALLGLLTGNISEGAELKLQAARIDPARFPVGAFGSDSAHRPDLPAIAAARAAGSFGRAPRGAEVIIIGDTPADVTCGRDIGARPIGVATGSYSVQKLLAAGAYAAFPDLSITEAVLEAIFG